MQCKAFTRRAPGAFTKSDSEKGARLLYETSGARARQGRQCLRRKTPTIHYVVGGFVMKFNHIVLRGLCAAGIAVSTACAGPSATSSVPAPPQLLHVPNSGMSYNTSATIDYYRFETGPSGAKVTKVVDSGTGRHNGTIL